MPDGKSILAVYPGIKDNDDDGLNLAILPAPPARGPVRLYTVPDVEEAGTLVMLAPAISGGRLYLSAGTNGVATVDLKTGRIDQHKVIGIEGTVVLYPGEDGNSLFCIPEDSAGGSTVFYRLDPRAFTVAPLATITNEAAGFFAYNRDGSRIGLGVKEETGVRFIVMEKGKIAFSRLHETKSGKLHFGNALFTPKGDGLIAACQREHSAGKRSTYGILEVPLSGKPVRETVLIPDARSVDEGETFYFQVAISHDGKTAAVASTYLACADDEFKPDDCALFLVNLADPNRKVTKVPIPLPKARKNPIN